MTARSLALLLILASTSLAQAPRPYVYRVLSHEVIDGDTVRTELDLGFRLRLSMLARLDGVDAPELSTPAGKAVRDWVRRWCAAQQSLVAVSVADDKYAGRYVAELHGDAGTLSDALIAARLVRLYQGGKRRAWPDALLRRIEGTARESPIPLSRAE